MRTSTRSGIQKQLDGLAPEAVEVIRQILHDPQAPDSLRLRAAELVLSVPVWSGDDGDPIVKTIRPMRSGPHLVPSAS